MKLLKNIFFSALVFFICICISEITLSLLYQFPNGYFVATPETSFVWEKDTLIKKGINHDSHVSFNHLGGRSISNFDKKEKIILAIGGSTTACYSLDQNKMWTALLEKKLGPQYWVGNFGKPGSFSTHHVLQLEQFTNYPDFNKIDKVIVMMGKNDFSASLINLEKYLSLSKFSAKINAFKHLPDNTLPWYRTFALTKLYKRTKHNLIQMYRRKTHGEELQDCRKTRLNTKEVVQLPNLTAALSHYERNAMKMIEIARKKKVELVFISQAVLWDRELSQEDSKLVCSCVIDKNIHYSMDALADGMSLFNKRLEEVCIREGIPFIWNDIESNSANFFDDCHYTETGAEIVAEEIYSGFQSMRQDHGIEL